jgi:hypothetical protein
MKNNAETLNEIKSVLDNFSAQNESSAKLQKNQISFEVTDNEDIAAHISALLEVCYYALDGNGTFTSPALKNTKVEFGVLKILEMTLNLVPHGQMHCLDRINEILKENDDDKTEIH